MFRFTDFSTTALRSNPIQQPYAIPLSRNQTNSRSGWRRKATSHAATRRGVRTTPTSSGRLAPSLAADSVLGLYASSRSRSCVYLYRPSFADRSRPVAPAHAQTEIIIITYHDTPHHAEFRLSSRSFPQKSITALFFQELFLAVLQNFAQHFPTHDHI